MQASGGVTVKILIYIKKISFVVVKSSIVYVFYF